MAATNDATTSSDLQASAAAIDSAKSPAALTLEHERTVDLGSSYTAVPVNTLNTAGPRNDGRELQLICGPLINYRRMSGANTENPTWHGSVLIVTAPGQTQPQLTLKCLGRVSVGTGATSDATVLPSDGELPQPQTIQGQRLYEDPKRQFWRFVIQAPIQKFEAKWEYAITPLNISLAGKRFIVPSNIQSMRILFHSCNGFSVGTNVEEWSGPALWNDVLRMHNQQAFHVMIGGGDQIYNDSVRVDDGPLREWTEISNPVRRREYPFDESLRARCDEFYFNNYVTWYSAEPFKTANGSIPQLNIWDDHDIIDGFGSYTDHFMRCAVFRGIGGVAHKYYLLFQHHMAPPKTTFTTGPATPHSASGESPQSIPQDNIWVLEDEPDPSYIVGLHPGPYVEECSRSIFTQLGARIAFLGIDARTERTRHQINYEETYDLIFKRVNAELAANRNIKHLILLLGVPIAYPRLQWLENIFKSPIIAPIRFLNKRFGLGGGLFNKFDGQVDLLDDLDDHYTARQHKTERRALVHRLQETAKVTGVRVSILGGDVHLAAVGRFYSKPALGIPPPNDWRYMPNIISSAITNKPPPAAVANLLARRNKVHHLDHETDETLLEIFDHDPGHGPDAKPAVNPGKKTAEANHATMPSRNYAIIAESRDHALPYEPPRPATGAAPQDSNGNGLPPPNPAYLQAEGHGSTSALSEGSHAASATPTATTGATARTGRGKKMNPRKPMHEGEVDAGGSHPAATGLVRSGLGGEFGLDVAIRVEVSNKDPMGRTEGYGFAIPGLDVTGYAEEGSRW
ncbi:hypothetical protein EJ06DRAFT_579527 [Trichodelitschia bisporula]|uniref:PhoD-like phosphatase domain-containing protein n=1 Tax=Trichodelitschia bisporula TaxID=703511 RepID=A0A6G1I5R2_9PEZI|nr:hypothetical protein EJ06DRAFT_579527 [Trichodelitschia bisporula]